MTHTCNVSMGNRHIHVVATNCQSYQVSLHQKLAISRGPCLTGRFKANDSMPQREITYTNTPTNYVIKKTPEMDMTGSCVESVIVRCQVHLPLDHTYSYNLYFYPGKGFAEHAC